MKKFYFLVVLFIVSNQAIRAQGTNIHYTIEASGGYISPGHIPFWMRSNQFGSIPLDNASMGFMGSIHKDYDNKNKKLIDWGASVEGRVNVGNKSNFTLIEGYGKIKVSVFEFKAGRSKEITGLCDSSLSSGAFAVSGNALGIPKVELSIPEFYSIPIFDKLFAFKGNYVHGWIGDIPVNMLDGSERSLKTFLHQKSLY